MKKQIIVLLILSVAFLLRYYGINWDNGFHLHPDERMLIMVAERIHFFDQLNPNFFNYGSLPIYLLKGVSQLAGLANYKDMLYIGRILSILFDLLTLVFIYKIVKRLFKKEKVALFASFFYAIAFFPIQNSHFFISDVFLTFFSTLLVFILLESVSLPSWTDRIKMVVLIGAIFSAMLSTKFTAIIFLPFVLVVIILKTIKTKGPDTKQPRGLFAIQTLINLLIFNLSLLAFSFLFMPYAFLNSKKFLSDILLQLKMNSDPYIFPYTLQYVDTLPYLYYLKNIFLWGLGPIISVLSLIGFISFLYQISKIKNQNSKSKFKNFFCYLLYITYYMFYFLVIGRSAVKFMRYMLPVYPFLVIMAGYAMSKFEVRNSKSETNPNSQISKLKTFWSLGNFNFDIVSSFGFRISNLVIIGPALIWSLSFINIYSQPHTRITATNWILKNIPAGSTLAVEHWDDRLPLYGGERYQFVEMTLYDQPDNAKKWQILNEKLNQADYIIIASNRLYVPLQKLTDCQKYKVCYPKTAEYYQKLFSGRLGFKKVAEFVFYPQFKIGGFKLEINDQGADESFTVFDHPKVMIFKKIIF